jgi:N-acyl homoserine lactone hydrolase
MKFQQVCSNAGLLELRPLRPLTPENRSSEEKRQMGIVVHALPVAEMAVPVNAVLSNLGGKIPSDIHISGITEVKWSDGTVTQGVKHPGCVYCIEGAGKTILVDTGVGDFERVRSVRTRRGDRFYLVAKPEWELVAQLKTLGLRPDDIEIVIITHLHWDHIGGNCLFRRARFYVPREDVPLALTGPRYAPHFFPEMADCITSVASRMNLVDTDAEIAPGVEVWKVGGHTPGSHVVAIEGDNGVIVLAGDVINKYENLEYDWPGPTGNMWNMGELLRAHARLKRHATIVIPGHDWKVWDRYPQGRIHSAATPAPA